MKNPRIPRQPSSEEIHARFNVGLAHRLHERDQSRRERSRLISLGVITPPELLGPTKIVKVDNQWRFG